MTRDELVRQLWDERHNGISWANETAAAKERRDAARLTPILAEHQAEDDELQAPRRRRLMANDFTRTHKDAI